MNYLQATEFIHSLGRFGSRLGLERVAELLRRMGNPQNRLRFVHVAGTNGKGSTCAMTANMLTAAGCRTGLYISPYVIDFRERIQVDGAMIREEDFAASASRVKSVWDSFPEEEKPTEFETLFAVTVDYYLEQRCDVVVLEVGMGGRLDATNAIAPPLAAVITSIGLDHTEYLGDTLGKIAAEKCGILKPGTVCVSYPRQEVEVLEVIMETCARLGIPLYMGGMPKVLHRDIRGTRFALDGAEYLVPLAGEHQVWNAVTALETVKALGPARIHVSREAARQGMAATRFPARLEVLGEEPLILLDGAHNPDGAKALGVALKLLRGRRIHCVMGMLADKDVTECLQSILPHCCRFTAVTPDNPRALPARQLAELASRQCPSDHANTPAQGFRLALARCEPEDVLLVCGSLFLASELRPLILERFGGAI